MQNMLKVFPSRWNTVGVGTAAVVSGVFVCFAVLSGLATYSLRYFVGGVALVTLGSLLLTVARRPWITVGEEGVWYLPYGRFTFEEIESVTPFDWMGIRGVKIRLMNNPAARGRKSPSGRVLLGIISRIGPGLGRRPAGSPRGYAAPTLVGRGLAGRLVPKQSVPAAVGPMM